MSERTRASLDRRKTLRALLALAQAFEENFTCDPGDEHTAQVLQDYVAQRALLLEQYQREGAAPPSEAEKTLLEELRLRDQAIQAMLVEHRELLRGELRQTRQQRRGLQGYRRNTLGTGRKLAVKG